MALMYLNGKTQACQVTHETRILTSSTVQRQFSQADNENL